MPVGAAPDGDTVGWVHTVDTPIGPLLLSADEGRLTRVEFGASTVFTSVVHSDHYPIMSTYPIPR